MKPPFICHRNLSRPGRSQSGPADQLGVTIILVALAMIGILAMAALSIDVITLYLARLEAQRSADAAALTAARLISVSGITGDPDNSTLHWVEICGGETSPASQAAHAVASRNAVNGTAIPAGNITVKYWAGAATPTADCSALAGPGAPFGVNPMVTVQVKLTSLPTFFSRIWNAPTQSVTATATAEAFNPSNSENVGNSGATGTIVPVQPRCVKPWVVPNQDPFHPAGCISAGCNPFVGLTGSSIQNKGISLGGGGAAGVIGETFTLGADCLVSGAVCSLVTLAPSANAPLIPVTPNLEYVPGAVPSNSMAAPSCGNASDFQKAVAGCDQTTKYQCGVALANTVDLSNNPAGGTGDTAVATQCLIHQATPGPGPIDADSLDTSAYPFKIKAGTGNPVTGVQGSIVTASNSIVSLPIYDGSTTLAVIGTTPVTVIGFLQVFINYVDANGNLNVTVLNVSGCGNGTNPTAPSPVLGTSPVPARLITTP